MRSWARSLACALLIVLPVSALHTEVPASGPSMQQDFGNPIWTALTSLGHDRATWARLLTQDLDGNTRTDFLDLTLTAAAATGQLGTPVELLVRGDAVALDSLVASHPTSVAVPASNAVFVVVPLYKVPQLSGPGITQVVWEPRAYVAASTNPAAGTPSTLPQIAMHQGAAAWTAGYTGTGVKIAIIDTGADIGHDALDAGKVTAFKDCVGTGTTSYDDQGHGTHVASIAAGDDGTDFRGIAYQASLVVVKVLDLNGSGTLAGFQCAVNWVKNAGTPRADVASMSAGLGVPPLGITTLNGGEFDLFGWDLVAEGLPNADIPFAVAAGNWIGTGIEVLGLSESLPAGVNGVNQVSSPGFATRVVTVGAVDQYQTSGTFTAVGPGKIQQPYKPDVAAMGVQTWGAIHGTTGTYEQWPGTSMATPLAAGTMALLVHKNASLTQAQYANALRNGATPGCILASNTACIGPAYAPDPNFVMGHGVVKASNSLALV